MAVCAATYVAVALFADQTQPDVLTLIACGAKDGELIRRAGEWWRLLSAGFLHGGIIHLVVNLYALRALGPAVERLWGRHPFVLIYLGAVAGGNLASLVATPQVSVGASSGVFGLFGAIVIFSTVYHRYIRPEARRGLWVNLAIVAVLNVGLGLSVPVIDNAAHVGGFAAGAVLSLALRPIVVRRTESALRRHGVRLLSAAAILATLASLAQAARYARSADWLFLLRIEMEPRTVAGGRMTLQVPKDWTHRPPTSKHAPHVFVRQGVGMVQLHLPPAAEAPDVPTFARTLIAQRTEGGARLKGERDMAVAGRVGTELVFLREQDSGTTVRFRDIVFPTPSDRVVLLSLAARAGSGFRLDLLFDLMVQSLRERDAPPRPASPWEQFLAGQRDPATCTALAAYYIVRRRSQGAESLLHLALALDPTYALAHDQLAYLYATADPPVGDADRALHHAERALELQPDTAAYLATLALVHHRAGRLDAAIEAARRAAKLAPDDARYADLVRRLTRERKSD
jgi:rhomboid protease GluP